MIPWGNPTYPFRGGQGPSQCSHWLILRTPLLVTQAFLEDPVSQEHAELTPQALVHYGTWLVQGLRLRPSWGMQPVLMARRHLSEEKSCSVLWKYAVHPTVSQDVILTVFLFPIIFFF